MHPALLLSAVQHVQHVAHGPAVLAAHHHHAVSRGTPRASTTAANVSLLSVLIRLVISLGLILGVIWAVAQFVKRRGLPGIALGARRGPKRSGGIGRATAGDPSPDLRPLPGRHQGGRGALRAPGRAAADRRGGARGAVPPIEVLSRLPLGKGNALMTVCVGTEALLLGVTPHGISTLATLDADSFDADEQDVLVERVSVLAQPGAAVGASRGATDNGTVAGIGGAIPRSSKLDQLRDMTARR